MKTQVTKIRLSCDTTGSIMQGGAWNSNNRSQPFKFSKPLQNKNRDLTIKLDRITNN